MRILMPISLPAMTVSGKVGNSAHFNRMAAPFLKAVRGRQTLANMPFEDILQEKAYAAPGRKPLVAGAVIAAGKRLRNKLL